MAVSGRRPKVCTEMTFEALSYCDLVQNLETVLFLISLKDLDIPNDGYPIVQLFTRTIATPCLLVMQV